MRLELQQDALTTLPKRECESQIQVLHLKVDDTDLGPSLHQLKYLAFGTQLGR